MFSDNLQQKFKILEMAMFSEWQKSNKKDREKICKKLGEFEAKLIIEEATREAKELEQAGF